MKNLCWCWHTNHTCVDLLSTSQHEQEKICLTPQLWCVPNMTFTSTRKLSHFQLDWPLILHHQSLAQCHFGSWVSCTKGIMSAWHPQQEGHQWTSIHVAIAITAFAQELLMQQPEKALLNGGGYSSPDLLRYILCARSIDWKAQWFVDNKATDQHHCLMISSFKKCSINTEPLMEVFAVFRKRGSNILMVIKLNTILTAHTKDFQQKSALSLLLIYIKSIASLDKHSVASMRSP